MNADIEKYIDSLHTHTFPNFSSSGPRETWSGKIYKYKVQNTTLAIKKFYHDRKGDYQRELSIFKLLKAHPHIIHYHGHNDLALCLVLEHAAQGDLLYCLDQVIQLNRSPERFPYYRIKYLLGAAKGLSYLHTNRIIHRDIKADNILITARDEAKLCDFAFSRQLPPEANCFNDQLIGSFTHYAPEFTKKDSNGHVTYTLGSDLWAFAVTIWMTYSFEEPYADFINPNTDHYDVPELMKHLEQGFHPSEEDILHEPVKKAATTLWNMNPHQRGTAGDVVKVFEEMFAKISNKPS